MSTVHLFNRSLQTLTFKMCVIFYHNYTIIRNILMYTKETKICVLYSIFDGAYILYVILFYIIYQHFLFTYV